MERRGDLMPAPQQRRQRQRPQLGAHQEVQAAVGVTADAPPRHRARAPEMAAATGRRRAPLAANIIYCYYGNI